MRRPGKKGSPLRYTSTLFTVGCESHDAFVPGLAMPVAPCALRCPSRPHLFARERLLPGNPAGPDTAHAGNTGTPPGERSGLAGAGHSPAACARPCRLYTALNPVHGSLPCTRPWRLLQGPAAWTQRLLPGNQRAALAAGGAWCGERQTRRKNAAGQHSRDTDWRGAAASGAFILRLCHDGKPHRPAFLGKLSPACARPPRRAARREPARPRATATRRARGGVPRDGEREPRGQRERDPNEGERETPALPPPVPPPPAPPREGPAAELPWAGRQWEQAEAAQRLRRSLAHPGDKKPENLRESKTEMPSIQIQCL